MILQISRVQMRRGLQEDLPQSLASAELGWSIDQRRLFIGNGTHEEGAPELGNTEILTAHSDVLGLSNLYTFKGLLGGYEVQTGDTPSSDVTRSMQDKFDDFANIRDFGVDVMGDGVYNCAHAFNHAIEQLYKAEKVKGNPAVRRTLYVPAGVYKLSGDYIRLLPYVKLKGDGKNSTFIVQTDASQPCTVMSTDIQINAVSVVPPGNIEVDGITFLNMTNNDVVILDATVDVLFNRVRMQGDPTETLPPPELLPAVPTASLRIRYSKVTPTTPGFITPPKNIYLTNCDFADNTYGIFTKDFTTNVNVIGGNFFDLYQGVAVGLMNIDPPSPSGIKVSHSAFDRIAKEGIIAGGPNGLPVSHVISAFNTFGNVGNGQRVPANQSDVVAPDTSVIYFNGDNCYSFGDTFARSFDSVIHPIALNGKSSFATMPNGHTLLGKQRTAGGTDTLLDDGMLTSTTAGVIGFGDYPTILEYTVLRGTEQRVGTLHITPIAGKMTFSDDYVETGDVGITLTPVLNNNVVELAYTSSVERHRSVLKLASRTLIGDKAPERMPDSVPSAPTSVTASLV